MSSIERDSPVAADREVATIGVGHTVLAPGQQESRTFCGRDSEYVSQYCPEIAGILLSEQGAPELSTGPDSRLLLKRGEQVFTVPAGLEKGLRELVSGDNEVYRQLAQDVVVPLSLGVRECHVRAVRCSRGVSCPAALSRLWVFRM
jgi:hypothetical protein